MVVWVNQFSSTDHRHLGPAVRPVRQSDRPPIQVDFLASDNSFFPHVSMDSTGRFVVVWENFNADGTFNIMMRYFSASGSPITDITRVSNPGSTDFNPDVAASNGSFIISWTHQLSATNDAILMPRGSSSPAASRSAKASSASTPTRTSRTARAWRCPRTGASTSSMSGSLRPVTVDIFASQYNGSGSFLRSVIVNFDSNFESHPSVSMDNSGNAVIAYEELGSSDSGIYANRLSAAGSLSGRITVQDVGGVNETSPSVALAPSGGQFVVALRIPKAGSRSPRCRRSTRVWRPSDRSLGSTSGDQHRRLRSLPGDLFAVQFVVRPS